MCSGRCYNLTSALASFSWHALKTWNCSSIMTSKLYLKALRSLLFKTQNLYILWCHVLITPLLCLSKQGQRRRCQHCAYLAYSYTHVPLVSPGLHCLVWTIWQVISIVTLLDPLISLFPYLSHINLTFPVFSTFANRLLISLAIGG